MKKKLDMKVDELRIESFETDRTDEQRGTVHGAQQTAGVGTCIGQPSCIICTRRECLEPSEPGYATYVNGSMCVRC